jgi:hypothetical protein
MQSVVHGVAFQQPCGLVAFDFSGERLDTLVRARCLGNLDDACSKANSEMFHARIAERYPRADVRWISNHCTGYPEECDSHVEMELHHLKTVTEPSRSGELAASGASSLMASAQLAC